MIMAITMRANKTMTMKNKTKPNKKNDQNTKAPNACGKARTRERQRLKQSTVIQKKVHTPKQDAMIIMMMLVMGIVMLMMTMMTMI